MEGRSQWVDIYLDIFKTKYQMRYDPEMSTHLAKFFLSFSVIVIFFSDFLSSPVFFIPTSKSNRKQYCTDAHFLNIKWEKDHQLPEFKSPSISPSRGESLSEWQKSGRHYLGLVDFFAASFLV